MTSEFWRVAGWTGAGVAVGAALRAHTPRLLATSTLGRDTWILAPAVTALLFGVLAWHTAAWLDLLAYSTIAAVGVPLATVDVLERRLPNALVYPAFATVCVLLAVSAAINSSWPRLAHAAVALLVTGAFYLVLALASHGGLGAGDVKVGAFLSFALGWTSWAAVAAAMALAWSTATLTWLALYVVGRQPRDSTLPMGVFLIGSALTATGFAA